MNYYFKSAKILGINILNIFFTISKFFSLVNCFALHLKYISKTCVINWFLKCIWRHTVRTLILIIFFVWFYEWLQTYWYRNLFRRLIEHFLIRLFYRWANWNSEEENEWLQVTKLPRKDWRPKEKGWQRWDG